MQEEEKDELIQPQEPQPEMPPAPDPQFSDSLQALMRFLRTPTQSTAALNGHAPLRTFFHMLLLSFGLSMLSMLLMSAFQKSGLLPELPHAMEDIMKQMPLLLVFVLVALFMPALEELAFRLWLVYRPLYVGVSLWLIAFFLSQSFLQSGLALAGYAVLGLAALATIVLLTLGPLARQGLEQLYTTRYRWIFWGSTLLFALVHLINFKPTAQVLLFAPLLVLPQFLLGLILGYVRVRQGLGWAIALHGVYNFIILGLAYWGMQAESPLPAGG
ncbi:CPBP family intramembrane glutamic endopeptidase [Cesiribacter andamanensis]|uniref:CAAX amino terminal protease self-immunity n=1 Tax=Cesiribacter andamanensis AMV16 TaxID=1279009 RepID=M7N0N7_9BACT|nr:CPBP family intramembrane glutamic endopeptidase [Cesiribacter andamanensis]EMR00872.1 CAAX amino terminal protease self- immunity [Cesiribacter andamanensis AMV16]